MNFPLLLQSVIILATIFAGIPIARSLLPDKDDGMWHIAGIGLSIVYCSLIVLIGLCIRNFLMQWITLAAAITWLVLGLLASKAYRPSQDASLALILYAALILLASGYQLFMTASARFPYSGAAGYPVDNFIPLWVNEILYYLKHPDSFALYPEWRISDRTPLLSFVETFFFHLFRIQPSVSGPDAPQAMGVLRFYFLIGIFLNGLVIIGAFWFLKTKYGRKAAVIGTALMGLAPFTLINTYYGWPKLFATFFFLSALFLIVRNESGFMIGSALGLSYLSHTMYSIFVPGIAVYYYFFMKHKIGVSRQKARLSTLIMIASYLIATAPWSVWVNVIYAHPSDKFFRYPFAVYYHDPNIMSSTALVLRSFFSTPLWAIIWIRIVNAVQSIFPVSFGMVPFGFPDNTRELMLHILRFYWSSIPGTLLVSTLIPVYYAFGRNFVKDRTFLLTMFILPFLIHLGIWGFAANNGMGGEMGRNDAHLFGPLLAGLVAAEALSWSRVYVRILFLAASLEFIAVSYINFIFSATGLSALRVSFLVGMLSVYCVYLVRRVGQELSSSDEDPPSA